MAKRIPELCCQPHEFTRCGKTLTDICRMAERHGFAEVGRGRLKTIRITGLWARIRAGPSPPLPVAGALYLGVVVLAPLLRLLPRDIILRFYRKR